MTDRTTKILLTIIALGLWVNVMMPLVHPAFADIDYSSTLKTMEHDLQNIYNGTCNNGKLC